MKLIDIIHFYLGAYCMVEGEEGASKIVAVHEGGIVYVDYNEIGSEEVNIDSIKLCLRPLSSMTEEEAKEFIKISYSNLDSNSIGPIMTGEHDMEFHFEKTAYHLWWSSISPKEYAFLISKQFDVFGLIESQQAIDISKLDNDATKKKD